MPTPYSQLAALLVRDKHLTQAQATELEQTALSSDMPVIAQGIKSNLSSSFEFALFLSKRLGLPYLDLTSIRMESLVDKINLRLMASLRFLPLSRHQNILHVALSDPTSTQLLDDLRFQLQVSEIRVIVVEEDKLEKMLGKIIELRDPDLSRSLADGGAPIQELLAEVDANPVTLNTPAEDEEVEDAPIVRFLSKILSDAIKADVSDIHFEPYEQFYRIRFRQDGQLYEAAKLPIKIREKLSTRIKVLSRLDISEKRAPQDGRLKVKISPHRSIDFRVSTLPTLAGEKIVMRVLDASVAQMGIEALGYEPEQRDLLVNAVRRPYGMVLVTGPTGSGKTVSLYACLNLLNDDSRNISTVEDPAEINVAGINQVNVNDRAGLTFSAALRSFLRQDPDVIMVGEVRDLETADIAMKAALTGHMVLSTLHTNNAPESLTRLVDMGMAPFNIASAVSLITAQRLARRLCPHCKKPKFYERAVLLDAGFSEEDLEGVNETWHVHEPVGCELCKDGYKGRVGVYQVMPVTEEMRTLILAGGNALQIAKIAEANGVRDLRSSGLLKVKQGVSSLPEILGSTNEMN